MKTHLIAALLGATLAFAPASAATVSFEFDATDDAVGYAFGSGDFVTAGNEGTFTLASGLQSFTLYGEIGKSAYGSNFGVSAAGLSSFSVTLSGGIVSALSFQTTLFRNENLFLGQEEADQPPSFNRLTYTRGSKDAVFTLYRDGATTRGTFTLMSVALDEVPAEEIPPPREPVTSAVPEPGTWALMIVGFGLTGTALRRRTPHRVLA